MFYKSPRSNFSTLQHFNFATILLTEYLVQNSCQPYAALKQLFVNGFDVVEIIFVGINRITGLNF